MRAALSWRRVVVASDQVADVLAGRSVAAFADLAVDEALEIVGDRDVHRAHRQG